MDSYLAAAPAADVYVDDDDPTLCAGTYPHGVDNKHNLARAHEEAERRGIER